MGSVNIDLANGLTSAKCESGYTDTWHTTADDIDAVLFQRSIHYVPHEPGPYVSCPSVRVVHHIVEARHCDVHAFG